jgi:hypothetical protein
MENCGWTDRVRKEEVLCRSKEERNVLRTVKGGKAKWVGHVLSRKHCLKCRRLKERYKLGGVDY